MNAIKDLRETDLFKGLDMKQLQHFGKHFTEKTLEIGELVFAQGGPADHIYILLEGEVTLGIKAKGEVDITASSVGRKGETFGLSALIKPYRNNVSATCTKKTRLLSISGEALRKLMKQNRKAGMEIMERVAEIYYTRLNNTRAMITNLFKMFKFQTGKSKLIETYYER
jgi:CRP-like cAMP-binding protein